MVKQSQYYTSKKGKVRTNHSMCYKVVWITIKNKIIYILLYK